MARSMTGFGVADGPLAGGTLKVELRTVNHRHFNAQIKTCSELQGLEAEIREALRVSIERGHVSLSARWMEEPERPRVFSADVGRAREILDAVRDLKDQLDVPGEVDLAFLVRQPDVLNQERPEQATIPMAEFQPILDAAVAGLLEMRELEGAALSAELERLLALLEDGLVGVGERAPERLVKERDRLRQSVTELLDGRNVDESRLAQELAFIADKLDVTEETVRLGTHIAACRGALGDGTAVGRKLAFLGQEMLREINTIGSKANDAAITALVIAMKGELEKFREQVENLE